MKTAAGVKPAVPGKMDKFMSLLDGYLKANRSGLEAVFQEFDADRSGALDRKELGRLVSRLMPEASIR